MAPFAPDEVFFYIARGLQGCGSAAMVPSAVGLLASTFPSGPRRSHAFISYTAASAVGSVLGNLAGGFIGGYLSWKWIFWTSSCMVALVIVAGYVFIPSDKHERYPGNESSRYVDWTGGFLISAGLALLLIAVSQANELGWDNFLIPGLVVISAMLILCFISWQRTMERNPERRPLIKISLFENPGFSSAFLIISCFYGSFNSFLVFASLL
ncbi:hypothetical protein ONZ43_g699 [Nemania bipapillata]|uniref:Uncharacterized protein n=1 Tax=Nemania bipapillata TaxID=110536 RepID=A0ACC2J832_9PEZI|nr:hypothetical protein ONZ43_g699 [Nemania bipapillata]